MTTSLCDEALIHRFFSIIGRMGIFGLLLEPDSDLTLTQLRVLFHLNYHGDQSMRPIAARLHVSDPTATGIIDRLVDKELIERYSDVEDRRRVCVRLTELGRQQVQAMRLAGAEAAASTFNRLTVIEREALFAALEPVILLLEPMGGSETE
jgi:DNA-binding MarR family transcriptional regulator